MRVSMIDRFDRPVEIFEVSNVPNHITLEELHNWVRETWKDSWHLDSDSTFHCNMLRLKMSRSVTHITNPVPSHPSTGLLDPGNILALYVL